MGEPVGQPIKRCLDGFMARGMDSNKPDKNIRTHRDKQAIKHKCKPEENRSVGTRKILHSGHSNTAKKLNPIGSNCLVEKVDCSARHQYSNDPKAKPENVKFARSILKESANSIHVFSVLS
jgi:hypothetical protein